MHPDKKVGLALGILLIGITGAFFFRNEASPGQQDGAHSTTDAIDEHIRRSHSRTPYFPDADKSGSGAALAEVPESVASSVMPTVPGRPSEPLPDPIRTHAQNPSDVVTPIPPAIREESDTGHALSQTQQRPRPVPSTASSSRLTQQQPVSTTQIGRAESPGNGRAGQPASASPRGEILHEVVQGETLSGIAYKYLGTHRRYLEIYEANRDVLSDPESVRVGQKLRIPADSNGSAPASTGQTGPNTVPLTTASNATESRGADSVQGASVDRAAATSVQPRSTDQPRASQPATPAPSFVRPAHNPLLPRRQTSALPTRRGAGSQGLRQSLPPDLPAVIGFDTTVIATLPDEDTSSDATRTK